MTTLQSREQTACSHGIRVCPIPTDAVRALQLGGPDANGRVPERVVSDGAGNPCRHCLCEVPKGAEMLILAHRPFRGLNPYAECGPIFLCAEPCAPWAGTGMPPVLATSLDYMLRGYDSNDRIVYGSGAVVARDDLATHARALLTQATIAYVHVRSARNGCYQCRIDRA